MPQEITEEEFREFCEDCHTPEFYKILKEVFNTPIYLRRYFELIGRKEFANEINKDIKDFKNPYPKDIFLWSNKKKLDFNSGRFNQHCFEIVENTKEDLKKRIEELAGNKVDKKIKEINSRITKPKHLV